MAKEWKDRQKVVDKLIPEFDDFCSKMDESTSTYESGGYPLSMAEGDPCMQYYWTMLNKLKTYTWVPEL